MHKFSNATETPKIPHRDFESKNLFSSFDDNESSKHEIDRSKILKKLGLSEMDVKYSMKLFAEAHPSGRNQCSGQGVKLEKILGYSVTRLRRSKALRLLGVTEEDIELENSKNLGTLGTNGRKRSFIVMTTNRESSLFSYNIKENQKHGRLNFDSSSRKMTSSYIKIDYKRRKSSTDLRNLKSSLEQMHASLRRHATSTQLEVVKLKESVRNLEEEIKEYRSSLNLNSNASV